MREHERCVCSSSRKSATFILSQKVSEKNEQAHTVLLQEKLTMFPGSPFWEKVKGLGRSFVNMTALTQRNRCYAIKEGEKNVSKNLFRGFFRLQLIKDRQQGRIWTQPHIGSADENTSLLTSQLTLSCGFMTKCHTKILYRTEILCLYKKCFKHF